MMQRWTVRDVMVALVVSVVLTSFLFVSERAEAAGKDRVATPSIAERFDEVEKKLVLVKDEPRSGSTSPDVLQRLERVEQKLNAAEGEKADKPSDTQSRRMQNRIEALEKKTDAPSTWKTLGFVEFRSFTSP